MRVSGDWPSCWSAPRSSWVCTRRSWWRRRRPASPHCSCADTGRCPPQQSTSLKHGRQSTQAWHQTPDMYWPILSTLCVVQEAVMMSDTIRRHISSEQRININTFNCVNFISPDLNKVQKYNKNSPKITWRASSHGLAGEYFVTFVFVSLNPRALGGADPSRELWGNLHIGREKSMLLLFFS